MYDVSRKKSTEYEYSYIYKSRNKCNQIIVCEAYRCTGGYINFEFYITTKRKNGYQEGRITGRDGICSLLWAKNCLIDFIWFARRRFKGETLIVHSDDSRRRKVYEYALIPLGFRVQHNRYKSLYIKL